MKIRTRIILSTLAVVAVLNVIYLIYFIDKTRNEALFNLNTHIAETDRLLQVVTAGPLYDGNVEQLNDNLDSFFRDPNMVEIVLTEYNGNIAVSRRREPPGDLGQQLESTAVILRGIDQLGQIHTIYTTAHIEEHLAESRNGILLLSGAVMLGLSFVIYLVAQGFTRPIDHLTAAAQAMADGNLDQAIEIRGAQELVILVQSFIRMRDAIQQKMADLAENNCRLNTEIVQRREAEQQRDRLVSIMEATTDIVGMADSQGKILYLNQAGRSMLGIELSADTPALIQKLHPQSAADQILNEGVPIAIKKGVWSAETAVLCADGREIPVSQVILSHKDAQGNLLYLSTIMRDISEQQDAQRQLEAREALLRRLSERIPGVIYQLRIYPDGHSDCPYCSQGVSAIYEVTPEEMQADAMGAFQRIHPDDIGAVLQGIDQCMNELTLWRQEYRVVLPQRGLRWLRAESMPERLEDGSVLWHGYITDVTDFKQAQETSQSLASIVEYSQDFIGMADTLGNNQFINPAGLKMIGLNPEDTQGKPIPFFIHESSQPLLAEEIMPALHSQGHWSGELNFRNFRTGISIPTLCEAFRINDQAGRPIQIATVSRDISERKRAEAALLASSLQLRSVITAAPLILWCCDMKGIFTLSEGRGLTDMGLRAGQVVGQSAFEIYADLPEVLEALKRVLAGESFEVDVSIANRRYETYYKPWLNEQGEQVGFVGVAVDITERKRSEEALRISEERLRQAIHVAKIGIFDHDHLAESAYWSPEIREMFGWSADEAKDLQGFLASIHPDDIEMVVAAVRRSHNPAGNGEYEVSYRIIRPSGDIVWIDTYGQTFFEDQGPARRPIRSVGATADITQRKNAELALKQLNIQLEQRIAERTLELAKSNESLQNTVETLQHAQEELLRSEKLASLGALVAGVAHELNTPLGNSLTVASALKEKVRHFSDEVNTGNLRRSSLMAFIDANQKAASMLTRNLYTASELISDFKQVAVDQTSAQRRPFDLREVVSEIVTTLQPQFKKSPHQILVDIPNGISMDSFPGPLGQVINNIVGNALIHGLDQSEAGVVRIEAKQTDSQVRLTFSDNGQGIAPDNLSRIFDPFFTTRLGKGGSGLGLHIVYSIVTRVLGGRISVKSIVGQGTMFTVELPLIAPNQTSNSSQ